MRAGRTLDDVYDHNLALVLAAVGEHGLHTRAAIADHTGLAKSSVGRLVAELTLRGLLRERRKSPTGVKGRPGMIIELASSSLVGLGLEVRSDGLAVWVADTAGRVRVQSAVSTLSRVRRLAHVLDELVSMADEAIRRAELQRLSLFTATVAIAPELGWSPPEVSDAIGPRMKLPVKVESAVTLAAEAELADPRGAHRTDCFHVATGDGVSGRVVTGGRVLSGPIRGAGFDGFGHMSVCHHGRPCLCGRSGCLQAYVRRASVLRDAGLPDATLSDLVERARFGDPRTVAALERSGRWLGVALASVVNLIAPPAIVLSGDVAVLSDWVVPAIIDELSDRVLGSDLRWPEVVVSRLGGNAAVIGAAAASLRSGPSG